MKPTFGIEEEVFIVEPTKPSIQSLYYLSKLVRKDPKHYLTHTDSNFSRNKDILQGLMSGVEISTLVHDNTDSLITDLAERRRELADVKEGYIVPLGHLLDFNAPTNTCALQFHVGNVSDTKQVFANLVHFLPLLFLLAANSPSVSGKYYGKSWRLLNSYAIGELVEDWKYRFQDIIFAKRTKTIEIRCFDPVYDIERVRLISKIIEAIVNSELSFKLDLDVYNKLRKEVAVKGYTNILDSRFDTLNEIIKIDKKYFLETPADESWNYYLQNGLVATYNALDNGYIYGKLKAGNNASSKKNVAKMITGVATYYVPKLPYDIWKYFKEN